MKISVSLPDEDVGFLDAYARARGVESRSAVLQRAVRLLRASELAADYEDAWEEWDSSKDSAVWEQTTQDGLGSNAAG
jgi:Arc/MetJ-type ribon-helix-helix transcriptional regulator